MVLGRKRRVKLVGISTCCKSFRKGKTNRRLGDRGWGIFGGYLGGM